MKRLCITACALTFLGCSTVPGPQAEHRVQGTPQVVQIWEYPASEFPAMCLLMRADGSLQFKGGFTFFNPGSWRAGSRPGAMVITLGGSTAFPTASAQQSLSARPRSLERFDAGRRELHFQVGEAKTDFLDIGGFYFYRAERCHAA